MPTKKGRIGDEAVKARTGKDWKQWFSLLDKAGVKDKSHREIAEYLDGAGVPGWWAQMITVTYEQERGLRQVHQKADGYSASASRTFAVPLGVLYGHWADEKLRKKWLDEKIAVRKATEDKSMRITLPDGTSVEANFYAKGDKKRWLRCSRTSLPRLQTLRAPKSSGKALLTAWKLCWPKNSYIYNRAIEKGMAAVVTRKFGEETLQFIGKKVAVETSDSKVYNGTLAGLDDKLDIVLDNVEGHGILKVILNGAFVKEVRLMEKPFDFKALAERLERAFPGLVKIREDVGAIIVMDKIKVTQSGVEEGSGLSADRVRSIFDSFMKETKK